MDGIPAMNSRWASISRDRGRGPASVGASILQTPGGVVAEIDKANADFHAFQQDIEGEAHGPSAPAALANFYLHVWTPLFAGWQEFYAKNHGWSDNFWWNHAPEAEQFLDQLIDVRATARKLGARVLSPSPTRPRGSLLFDPEHNLVDEAADAAKKQLADVMKIVKVGLIVGIGLTGVLVAMNVSRRTRAREPQG